MDDFFERMAKKYVDEEGRRLKEEMESLGMEGGPPKITPLKVKRQLNQLNYKKYLTFAAPVAAAVLILFLAKGGPQNQTSNSAEAQHEIINLSFTPPENFSISKIMQDKGETIYYIEDKFEDDVTLTVQKKQSPLSGPEIFGLKEILINDKKAYIIQKNDYSILKFVSSGNLYTLTCKYQPETLISLGGGLI
ncbi:MAG: hypothetical protein LBV08_03375 [Clostridiales bacterium]|jgi:hypothetical protein|nr:hypothetical protein [Clostridiales bacterium]